MANETWNVLFLCTGNSARSQLAECILNRLGDGRFRGFSAGSQPSGAVHPLALELLGARDHDVSGLRSKNWDEFARDTAPRMDLVVTVCDNAAGEVCPVWPGHPMTAHWGLPDPAAAEGSEADRAQAFVAVYDELNDRLMALVGLPIEQLDRASLLARVRGLAATD